MIATSIRCLIAAAFVFTLAGALTACNTVEGLGKDISAAGRALGSDSKKH